jgi:hypothetical protein
MKGWVQTLLILIVLAAALRTADAIPQLLTGLPRGAVMVTSLPAAQQVSGIEVRLPQAILASYRLRDIVALHPPEAGVKVDLEPVAGGRGFSLFRMTATERAQKLLPGLSPFHEIPVQVAGRPARLRAARDSGGLVTQDLEWQGDLRTVVRFQGPTLELMNLGAELAAEMP